MTSAFPDTSPLVQLWEFADAPEDLRALVPAAYSNGWIALIHRNDLVHPIIAFANAHGLPIWTKIVDSDRTVLGGPHARPEP